MNFDQIRKHVSGDIPRGEVSEKKLPDSETYRKLCSLKVLQNTDRGTFNVLIEKALDEVGERGIHEFNKLNTDQERIGFCSNLDICRKMNIAKIYRKKCLSEAGKRLKEAERMMEEGDGEQMKKCLMVYSQSIMKAPTLKTTQEDRNGESDNCLTFTRALIGRAIVLLRLGEFKLALRDLKYIEKQQYPAELRFQLYDAMGQVLGCMKEYKKAHIAFQIALRSLDHEVFSSEMKENGKIRIQQRFKAIEQMKTKNSNNGLSLQQLLVAKHLLGVIQQLQFNVFEIHEQARSKVGFRKSTSIYLGVGLYLSASAFNHECYPALTGHFSGTKIVLTSLRKVRQGDPLSANYGPLFTRMSLEERQKWLKGRYWFSCNCPPCTNNWPMYNNMNTIRDTSRYPKKVKPRMMRIFEKGLDLMDKNDGERAKDKLIEFIKMVDDESYIPIKEIHLAQEALKLCLTDQGTVYYTEE